MCFLLRVEDTEHNELFKPAGKLMDYQCIEETEE